MLSKWKSPDCYQRIARRGFTLGLWLFPLCPTFLKTTKRQRVYFKSIRYPTAVPLLEVKYAVETILAFCWWWSKNILLLLGLHFTIRGPNHRVYYTCLDSCMCLESYRLQKSLVHVQVLQNSAHNALQQRDLCESDAQGPQAVTLLPECLQRCLYSALWV